MSPSRPAYSSSPAATPARMNYPEPAAAAPVPSGAQATSASDAIAIPMAVIVPKLSGHLAKLAIKSGGTVFHLPVSTALEQLPTGRVRVPFGELRRGVPHGTFADNETHDDVMIELPLSPILLGMSPNLLARRAQKKIEVPPEVIGVFGPKGTISARTASADLATASAAPGMPVAPEIAPAKPPPPPAFTPPKPAAPAPARTAAPAPAPIKPVAPALAPVIPKPIAPRPIAPRPIAPVVEEPEIEAEPVEAEEAPTFSTAPVTPIAPAPGKPAGPIRVQLPPKTVAAKPLAPVSPIAAAGPAPGRLPSMGVKPAAPISPISPIAASAFSAPIVPKGPISADVVAVPLSDISDAWADPVRQEIARGEWDLAMVMFPTSRLEAGMKAGRLNFTWGEVRQWLNPPIGSIPSQHVDVPVELPLKVIAPLFMQARRPVGQRRVDVDETIPDVFSGLNPGAARVKSTAPAAPVPTAPEVFADAVGEIPISAPPAGVSHAPRPDPLGTIFGQPLKSEWSPAEITQKICDMNGVAGSVITMADGLLVAGAAPAPQRAETLAAFLPQIFSRLTQYAGEMQLGTLNGLTLATAGAPCAIYRAGKLYLGVIGRVGQSLPESQIQRIAAEIAKRNP